MTLKNTKLVLFASLIVAMILPFSGMDFATAEEQTNDNVEKTTQLIDTLKIERDSISIDTKDIDNQIERLEIARNIMQLEDEGLKYSPQAQDLFKKLQKNLDANVVVIEGKITSLDGISPPISSSDWQYDEFITGLQITQSCNETMIGQSSGSLTQYDDVSYLIVTPDYPSVFDCNKIHSNIPIDMYDLSGMLHGSCHVDITYASGVTAVVTCEDFGLNDDGLTTNIVLITTNSYYQELDGSSEVSFTWHPGWTWIVY